MPWYAVLSAGCRETVEILSTREEAERFVAEAVADEPEFEGLLSVEPVEVPEPSPNLPSGAGKHALDGPARVRPPHQQLPTVRSDRLLAVWDLREPGRRLAERPEHFAKSRGRFSG
jgi:hypothetical protein